MGSSCHVTCHLSLTVQSHARHLKTFTNWTPAHDSSKFRLFADWSVENMNPDMTPKGMLLDVSVLTEFLFNKHTILMRLRNIFKKNQILPPFTSYYQK